jgi:predicted AAA+ superfamily ATPase
MDIKRALFQPLQHSLAPGKVVLLYGPRRVGKSWLLDRLIEAVRSNETVKLLSGEDRVVQEALSSRVIEQLKLFVEAKTTLLVIDEAQRVPDIGLNLKLLVDHMPDLKIVASGSASFDLAQQVGEPLTGRKITYHLYPVWAQEEIDTFGMQYHQSLLEQRLIFGGYPELYDIDSERDRRDYLHELVDSYLLRDILELDNIRNARKLTDLLTLLAFQIGGEVSLNELGTQLELHRDTVSRYLELLEKAFVIRNVRGFSRNLRKEVTKTSRYYFYDNGIRNTVINNFNPLQRRDDTGMLWENYLVSERLKKQSYERLHANNYFWRTYDQKELDWVEEREGRLYGYEFKYRANRAKPPKGWMETYDNAEFDLIHKGNYLQFIASPLRSC